MDEFIRSVNSSAWWLSVVLVSVLLNVIASYLKDFLDRAYAQYSESRAASLAAKDAARNERIVKIRSSERNLYIAFRGEQRGWLWVILMYVLAALLLVLPTSPILLHAGANLVASILMILGIQAMRKSVQLSSEIDDAIRETK